MKIWRFYKTPTDKNDVKQSYDLYALTNNKEFASYFMSTRDMNKFYVRRSKEDRETYSRIANDNRECVLEEFKLITGATNPDGIITHKSIDIIMTHYEYQCINGDEFQCEITGNDNWWKMVPNYQMYKDKIKNALRVIEYITNYKFYALPFQIGGSLDDIDDDYSAPDMWIDEFGAFISIFKSTFK